MGKKWESLLERCRVIETFRLSFFSQIFALKHNNAAAGRIARKMNGWEERRGDIDEVVMGAGLGGVERRPGVVIRQHLHLSLTIIITPRLQLFPPTLRADNRENIFASSTENILHHQRKIFFIFQKTKLVEEPAWLWEYFHILKSLWSWCGRQGRHISPWVQCLDLHTESQS